MKKLCAVILALALALCNIPSAKARDVNSSKAGSYKYGGVTIPYRLVLPDSYDGTSQYPLVVFFHGAGERGNDNTSQLINGVQQIANSMPNAIILAPQCPSGNQWVDTPWENGSYSTSQVAESGEMKAVMALVQKIKQEYSVDSNCVYAMGISMGGYAVWDAMIRHNDVFAAGVAVCGAGDPSKARTLKNTPMFVYHGTADLVVPVSGSEEMVAAIRSAGGTKVRYTAMEGRGHGIWGTVFSMGDLYSQLQKCKLSDRYGNVTPETVPPTEAPTTAPTEAPTTIPTTAPTEAPTTMPTTAPTEAPTTIPTTAPTEPPTQPPTQAPTEANKGEEKVEQLRPYIQTGGGAMLVAGVVGIAMALQGLD